MTVSAALFVVLRATHVLLATLWVGATAFTTFFLFPSVAEAGPAAGPVMAALMRRKVPVYMASLGGIVVLTGIYLYYRFTSGFDPAISGTRPAMVFGAGGILGIAALLIGGIVVSRNVKKMAELGARAAAAPQEQRSALASQLAIHRERATTASRIVVALQIVSVVLMAIGHYV